MRAVVATSTGGPEVPALREVPTPIPGPSEGLVAVAAAAPNLADVRRREGAYVMSPAATGMLGLECSGTAMASDAGPAPRSGPRDYAKVKRDLAAAGYNGDRVLPLVPAASLDQKPLGDVAGDMFKRVGMNVETVSMNFASVLTRRNRREPVEQSGWSAVAANWQGIDWLNPAGHLNLQGEGTSPGWHKSERIPALRERWLATGDLAERQRICREIREVAVQEVPFYPIGQYFQPSVHRAAITGIGRGTATFWNVRPA